MRLLLKYFLVFALIPDLVIEIGLNALCASICEESDDSLLIGYVNYFK